MEELRVEGESGGPQITDEAIELLQRQRFQQRVQRVLAVMREERVDWRGVAFLTPDGRIGVRVVPVEMPAGAGVEP
jgi:hypothetical protein